MSLSPRSAPLDARLRGNKSQSDEIEIRACSDGARDDYTIYTTVLSGTGFRSECRDCAQHGYRLPYSPAAGGLAVSIRPAVVAGRLRRAGIWASRRDAKDQIGVPLAGPVAPRRPLGWPWQASGTMEEVFQNGNYQREANANMTAVETRKEVKEASARFFARVRPCRIDKSLALISERLADPRVPKEGSSDDGSRDAGGSID